MICFLTLIVFGIIGIFSATHRKIAWEAFSCVFRKVTLRKCDTGLDVKMKSQITGKLLKFWPKAGKFVYKHFEMFSWFFTIIFILSLAMLLFGGYNYYMYGNCNGPNEAGFCVFDPTGSNTGFSQPDPGVCSAPVDPVQLTLEGINLSLFPSINKGAENKVVFIGCYACEYTREAFPTIKKLAERDDTEFIFAHFPVKDQTEHLTDIQNCVDPSKLTELSQTLFDMTPEEVKDVSIIDELSEKFNIDKECLNTTRELSSQQFDEIQKTGIYGTPLVFVNGEPVVGPKPTRVYRRLLK